MRVRALLLFLVAFGLGTNVVAQPDPTGAPAQSERQAVRATIDALFDGMRAGDSAAVRSLFASGAHIRSLNADDEQAGVKTRTANDFAQSVGQPRDAVWDERIWDVEIRVDGPMATARMPYVFYVGAERSHCGVNNVHFVRVDGAWRVQHITYTRREDCEVPQEVRK